VATINPVDPRTANGALKAPVAAAGGGDVIPMLPGRTYLVIINNGGGAGITASIDDPASGSGQVEYSNVSIAAGASQVFAFKRPLYGKVDTDRTLIRALEQLERSGASPEAIVFTPSYLGLSHRAPVVVIQVFMNAGRTVEVKKALYAALADAVTAAASVRREDVIVNLVEVPRENWSFGGGVMSYPPSP